MKTKQLKVYTKYSPRAYNQYKQVAEIRLNGIWLEQLGFTPHTPINVSYENQKIILTPKKI
ncbi:SymE family type I addiction module toxin [Flavobacterium davisii]|uniref:Type I addiction module toxin, SymE family n=2 Tax=Flavobacterium TaxID=237 RepID=A0A437U7X9_9FLAO|nr:MULTISPECIES: SymE family type I addiction module toxin [Flavobacterium]OWP82712.1 hypothetical protein BWK59_14380 [Flavobacterium davisii]RVU89714.1 type I addiction module toxin, SymE family [Flavobacterium columnare]RVU89720.1 type I addiction module toxin, SymE family [Flavobacterium columnare]RVU89726.1 type I addiction module toxin, SymE family [Flavobacterium columnare]RVU89733.1 type I addiction module toxin, SymE family [Flavobacterium columnare]